MEPLRPSRRVIARGAVWTVPVIAVAATAPAYAASACDCASFSVPAFPASGTSGAWTLTSNGNSAGGGTDRFLNGSFVTVEDAPIIANRVVTASTTICVAPGKTYRFIYSWTAYTANTNAMTSVLRVNGATVNGSTINTANSSTSGTRNVTWSSGTTTGTVTLSFVHTVGSIVATDGDDITINSVTASCV